MKKILFVALMIGFAGSVAASENAKKVERWDDDSWDEALEQMPEGSVERGKKLAQYGYCYTCHGDEGIARTNNAPSLAGIAPQWTYKALLDYKSGLFHLDWKSTGMIGITQPMSKQDMSDLAVYYAQQKRPKGKGGVKKPKKVKKCMKCHDSGDEDDAPSLLGQSSMYIERQLLAYKHKKRLTEVDREMRKVSKKLKKKKIRKIAEYYYAQ